MKLSNEQWLQAIDNHSKMRRAQLLTPAESAQVVIGPGGKVSGPTKVLAKLLRKLKKKP